MNFVYIFLYVLKNIMRAFGIFQNFPPIRGQDQILVDFSYDGTLHLSQAQLTEMGETQTDSNN